MIIMNYLAGIFTWQRIHWKISEIHFDLFKKNMIKILVRLKIYMLYLENLLLSQDSIQKFVVEQIYVIIHYGKMNIYF